MFNKSQYFVFSSPSALGGILSPGWPPVDQWAAAYVDNVVVIFGHCCTMLHRAVPPDKERASSHAFRLVLDTFIAHILCHLHVTHLPLPQLSGTWRQKEVLCFLNWYLGIFLLHCHSGLFAFDSHHFRVTQSLAGLFYYMDHIMISLYDYSNLKMLCMLLLLTSMFQPALPSPKSTMIKDRPSRRWWALGR